MLKIELLVLSNNLAADMAELSYDFFSEINTIKIGLIQISLVRQLHVTV